MENQNKGTVVKKTPMYTRIEDDEKTVIISRTEFTYLLYLCLALILAGSMLRGAYWVLAFLGCAVMVAQWIYSYVTMKDVNAEVRAASSKGLVAVSGNKISMSNPLTITIMHENQMYESGEEAEKEPEEPDAGDSEEGESQEEDFEDGDQPESREEARRQEEAGQPEEMETEEESKQ